MSPRRPDPKRVLALAALAATVGACADFEGEVPDAGELHFPVGMAVHSGGRYLYTVSTNFDASYRVDRGGMVSVIDLETLRVVPEATVRVGSYGGAVQLSPDGERLVVTTRGDDSLVVLDVATDGSDLTCRGAHDGLRCRIDGLPNDPFDVIPAPFVPDATAAPEGSGAAAPEDVRTFAVTGLDGDVAVVTIRNDDLDGADVFRAGLIDGASTIVEHPLTTELLVAGRFSNTIAAIAWFRDDAQDVAGIVATRAASIPTTASLSDARDLVLSSDGTRGWLSTNSPDGIVTLDTSVDGEGQVRLRYLARHDIDGAPAAMVVVPEAGRDVLYVALPEEDAIAVVDAASGMREATVHVGARPFDLTLDPTRPRLYVSLFDDHAIGVIDLDPSSPQYRSLIARIR